MENHLNNQFQESRYVYEVYDNDPFEAISLKITDITDTKKHEFSYISLLPVTQDSFFKYYFIYFIFVNDYLRKKWYMRVFDKITFSNLELTNEYDKISFIPFSW